MPDFNQTGLESVRPATEADLPRCRELVAQAAREGSEAGGSRQASAAAWSQLAEPTESKLTESGPTVAGPTEAEAERDEERITLVGCFAGTVVGLAVAHLEDRAGEVVGALDGCYVEPAARGVGVGGALLEQVVTWVDEHGGQVTEAHARPGDRSTKRLLESAGFATRELILRRSSRSRPDQGIRPDP